MCYSRKPETMLISMSLPAAKHDFFRAIIKISHLLIKLGAKGCHFAPKHAAPPANNKQKHQLPRGSKKEIVGLKVSSRDRTIYHVALLAKRPARRANHQACSLTSHDIWLLIEKCASETPLIGNRKISCIQESRRAEYLNQQAR